MVRCYSNRCQKISFNFQKFDLKMDTIGLKQKKSIKEQSNRFLLNCIEIRMFFSIFSFRAGGDFLISNKIG